MWPQYDRRLRDVGALMEDQLAITMAGHAARPESERWPIWATVGHAALEACLLDRGHAR